MPETSWKKILAFGVELPLESKTENAWARLIKSSPPKIELFEDILSPISIQYFVKINNSMLDYYKKSFPKMKDKEKLGFDLFYSTFIKYFMKRLNMEYEVIPEYKQQKLISHIDKIIKLCQKFVDQSQIFEKITERLNQTKESLLSPLEDE